MANSRLRFVTLDVFTNRWYGNQLAVVDVTDNELSHENMQAMAREFNFSETVFLDQGYQPFRIHIFTPVNEMDFAGHPVIGTGHVIFRQLLPSAGEATRKEQPLSIQKKAGRVAIRYDPGSETVTAEVPHDVHVHSRDTPKQNILHIQPGLAADKTNEPMKDGYTNVSIVKGVTYVLVDLTGNPELFAKVNAGVSPDVSLDDGWGPSFTGTIYYMLPGTHERDGKKFLSLRMRMIAINLEDPACGGGCSALGAYLALKDGSPNGKHRFECDQGSEIGRDSSVVVDMVLNEPGSGLSTLWLSGQAAMVTEGMTALPE